MTKNNNKIDLAKNIFNKGFNCCQAVFVPFALEKGMDEKTSLEIASGFAAGLCYKGETCGAVIGAQMALGLYKGYSEHDDQNKREAVKKSIAQHRKLFVEKYKTTICKELLGADPSTDKGMSFLKENEIFELKCPEFVVDSAQIVDSLIE